MKENVEEYLGFYMLNPIWAVEKPDIEKLKIDPEKFSDELSQVVISNIDKNFKIKICRDGFILIQISKLVRKIIENDSPENKSKEQVIELISEHIAYLNAFQILLSSSTATVQELSFPDNVSLSQKNVFFTSMKNDEFFGTSLPAFDITQSYLRARSTSHYNPNFPLEFDQRISLRYILRKEIFDKSINNFKKIFEKADLLYILAQINSASCEFNQLQFGQSLILSWFVIEYFINKHWINFLLEKRNEKEIPILNGTRIDFLIGRDITSSIKLNMLELNGRIPHDIYIKIDKIRAKRNNIIHSIDKIKRIADALKESPKDKRTKSITHFDCYEAFDILEYFTLNDYKIELCINRNFSYSLF